ncbi:MAG: squalene/phytoene synthase family protein [Nitrospira sp.]|nr:squalene/phytoene synthase family protein [Nitrospira sp.]
MITRTDLSKQELLRDLLKQVSRLFYTTLAVVPADVRDQVSLAYLFARAADTIADTDLIDRHRRLDFLSQLKGQFIGDQIVWGQVQDIQRAIGPLQQHSAERVLLERLDQCFRLLLDFSPEDRRRVQRLMTTLTQGMEMDLSVFPGQTVEDLTALKTVDDLDRYTYYVAGCVGEFWTDLMCAHRKALRSWNVRDMSAVGARFGKGLQLTNIVKEGWNIPNKGDIQILQVDVSYRSAGNGPSVATDHHFMEGARQALAVAVMAAAKATQYDPRFLTVQLTMPMVAGSFHSGTRVDGPSAGAAWAVAVTSALLGDPLRSDVCFSGTIDEDLVIGPVGGLEHKIEGCHLFPQFHELLLPAGQQTFAITDKGMARSIKVTEVSTLAEAYEVVTGQPLRPAE